MDATGRRSIVDWIAEQSLAGLPPADLLVGFCRRLNDAGLAINRARAAVGTLHPVLESTSYIWERGTEGVQEVSYGRGEYEDNEEWTTSPFFVLWSTQTKVLRRRLTDPDWFDFPVLAEIRDTGATDYLAMSHWFGEAHVIGEMESFVSSWATDAPDGFTDDQIATLDGLVVHLAVAYKVAAMAGIARNLAETYLGRETGRRLLGGQIDRGEAERMRAVLWYSDLHGSTRIADTEPPDTVIDLLNAYSDCLVTAVHDNGGEVLKFIGDGVLAVFTQAEADACNRALDAVRQATRSVDALNRSRRQAGVPVTGFSVALHLGDVFYGNIGSIDRLDFTVIGPAVNEVSRIEGLSRSLEQTIVISEAFAGACGGQRRRLVSLGRYALRGIRRPQELFTLDPTFDDLADDPALDDRALDDRTREDTVPKAATPGAP